MSILSAVAPVYSDYLREPIQDPRILNVNKINETSSKIKRINTVIEKNNVNELKTDYFEQLDGVKYILTSLNKKPLHSYVKNPKTILTYSKKTKIPPKCRMGILTGNTITNTKHKNNIVVLDLDFMKPKSEWFIDGTIEHHPFIVAFGNNYINYFNTFTTRTQNGGIHMFFKLSDTDREEFSKTHHDVEYAIDYQSDKAYVCFYDKGVKGDYDKPIQQLPESLKDFIRKMRNNNRTLKNNTLDEKKTVKIKIKNKNIKNETDSMRYVIDDFRFKELCEKMKALHYHEWYGAGGGDGENGHGFLKFATFCKTFEKDKEWRECVMSGDRRDRMNENDKIYENIEMATGQYITESILEKLEVNPMCYKYKIAIIPGFKTVEEKNIIRFNRRKITDIKNEDGTIDKSEYDIITFLKKYDGFSYIIKSDTGTGKTTAFITFIESQKNNFCSIVSREALADDQVRAIRAKGIQVVHYKDKTNKIKNGRNLVICVDSLLKTSTLMWENYIIFLDELNSMIEHVITSGTLERDRIRIFDKLINAIRRCKMVIGVDADISPLCFELLSYCGVNYKFLENSFLHNEGIEAEELFYDPRHGHVSFMLKNENENYLVGTDVAKLAVKLQLETADPITNEQAKVVTRIYDLGKGKVMEDFSKIIISPKITYGVDDLLPRNVYGIYGSRGGEISPKAMAQQVTRCRNIKKLFYCFDDTSKKKHETLSKSRWSNYDECVRDIERDHRIGDRGDNSTKTEHIELFNKLKSYINYEEDCFVANKYLHFRQKLKKKGFVLKNINDRIVDSKSLNELYGLNEDGEREMKIDLKNAYKAVDSKNLEYFNTHLEKFFNCSTNRFLQLPKNRLSDYSELFLHDSVLKHHLMTSKFIFKSLGSMIYGIYNYQNDYNSSFIHSNEPKVLFLKNILNDITKKEYCDSRDIVDVDFIKLLNCNYSMPNTDIEKYVKIAKCVFDKNTGMSSMCGLLHGSNDIKKFNQFLHILFKKTIGVDKKQVSNCVSKKTIKLMKPIIEVKMTQVEKVKKMYRFGINQTNYDHHTTLWLYRNPKNTKIMNSKKYRFFYKNAISINNKYNLLCGDITRVLPTCETKNTEKIYIDINDDKVYENFYNNLNKSDRCDFDEKIIEPNSKKIQTLFKNILIHTADFQYGDINMIKNEIFENIKNEVINNIKNGKIMSAKNIIIATSNKDIKYIVGVQDEKKEKKKKVGEHKKGTFKHFNHTHRTQEAMDKCRRKK